MARVPKRMKERLIAAHRAAEAEVSGGFALPGIALAARELLSGETGRALKTLALDAGQVWRVQRLARFDLRLVDERGGLIAAGWLALPTQPDARKCLALTAPGVQCQEPATHEGHEQEGQRCFGHAPEHYAPMASVCLTWQAGDHLDDVLAEGANRVAELARQALVPQRETTAAATERGGTKEDRQAACAKCGGAAFVGIGGPLMLHLDGSGVPVCEPCSRAVGGDPRAWAVRDGRIVPNAGAASFGTPRWRPVPQTREQFLDALGVERGRTYPGLRERVAEWMGLPLTEEQSKAEAASARALDRRCCDSCWERSSLGQVFVTCGGCGREAIRSDAAVTNSGWRCASCASDAAFKALNDIAGMLDLPAGGELPKVVPAEVAAVLTAIRVVGAAAADGLRAVLPLLTDEQRDTLDKALAPLAKLVETFALSGYRWTGVLDERPRHGRPFPAPRPYGPGQAGLLEHQLAEDRLLLGCSFVEQTPEGRRRVEPALVRRRTDGTHYRSDTGGAVAEVLEPARPKEIIERTKGGLTVRGTREDVEAALGHDTLAAARRPE